MLTEAILLGKTSVGADLSYTEQFTEMEGSTHPTRKMSVSSACRLGATLAAPIRRSGSLSFVKMASRCLPRKSEMLPSAAVLAAAELVAAARAPPSVLEVRRAYVRSAR